MFGSAVSTSAGDVLPIVLRIVVYQAFETLLWNILPIYKFSEGFQRETPLSYKIAWINYIDTNKHHMGPLSFITHNAKTEVHI